MIRRFGPRQVEHEEEMLIEEAFALGRATETRNSVIAAPFTLELVIICEFFV